MTMKIRPIWEHSPAYADYIKRMANELSKQPKRPVSHEQCASTKAILARDPAKDAEHWNRPIPVGAQLVSSYIEMEQFERKITPEEETIIDGIRKGGQVNTFGGSELSATTDLRREKATNAYIYSEPGPMTEDQKEAIKRMNEDLVPPVKISLLSKLKALILPKDTSADYYKRNFMEDPNDRDSIPD